VSGRLSVLPETMANVDLVAFYKAEHKQLVRFVMTACNCEAHVAEDAVQAAYIKAFPAWDRLRDPRAWLRTVARNEFFRYRAYAKETSLDAAPVMAERAEVSAAVDMELREETRGVLSEGIAALPPKQREVMAWAWDGFTDEEIAAHLGDSPQAVRKNRSRAMKNLRRSLFPVRRAQS
jgi:RNA polymerase sigma factor (sigma-70 family)